MRIVLATVFLAHFSSGAIALTASDYFPLVPGDSWTVAWRENTGATGTETQVVGSIVSRCGKNARRIAADFGDDLVFSDSTGVGIVEIIDDDTTVSFCNSTLLVIPSSFSVGTQVTSSGDVTVAIVGEGSGTVPYTATSTVQGIETVTVPAGTFETLKVYASASGSGFVPNVGNASVSADYTWWVAKGIGVVKEESYASVSAPGFNPPSAREVDELIETNLDSDKDLIGRAFDNCPSLANSDQADLDSDGQGDVCDTDDDGDGVVDLSDNCALIANADQADLDGDGDGNVCDSDIDGDGESNADERLAGTDPYDARSSTRSRNATVISILQQLIGD